MNSRIRWYSLLFVFGFILGCAPVISSDLKGRVDSSVTFNEVFQNPDGYKGKVVLWGGKIIQVVPEDGKTLVEVLETPLNRRGKPEKASASGGRFFILVEDLMDFSKFKTGEKITVAGVIEGATQPDKMKALAGTAYRYPLVLSKEMHLWKEHKYPYSNVADYRETWEYHHYYGILNY